MFKGPNSTKPTIDIWFKDGGSIKDADIPSNFIEDTGRFLMYWDNEKNLKGVNIDNVDQFVLKNAYEPDDSE